MNNKPQSELTSCPVKQKMAAKLREGASPYYQPLLASEELAHSIEELRFVFIGIGQNEVFLDDPTGFLPNIQEILPSKRLT
ncbi:MAG: hypothetical protein DMG05_23725 [Acidobacteria bacterium]|nr:MAG: hypothetical protein DMG05_23725 [Acidobacteriota bacterium]